MNYLVEDKFDARYMMGSLPIQHYLNVALWRHHHGIERITPSGSKHRQTIAHEFLMICFSSYAKNLSEAIKLINSDQVALLENDIIDLWNRKGNYLFVVTVGVQEMLSTLQTISFLEPATLTDLVLMLRRFQPMLLYLLVLQMTLVTKIFFLIS